MTESALELRGVSKRFGRTQALDGVDFTFTPGVAHALLGENGSGKTTLMKIACGEYAPSEGEILLRGRSVRFANPLQAHKAGVTMVAQEVPVVAPLTVGENIVLGNLPKRGGRVNWRQINETAAAALAQMGSDLDPRRQVSTLRPSDRQIVAIARAVAADSAVVIFDEPTSSLTAERTDALFAIIERMKARGTAIAFISQRLQDIAPVAELVTVIRDGKAVRTLPIGDADEASITRLMVGRDLDDYFHREVGTRGHETIQAEPVLEVRNVSNGSSLNDVSFAVRPGEVVGLAGLVGSGHSDIIRGIFGAEHCDGTILVGGTEYPRRSPRRSIDRGIALVTGDRKHEGLVAAQSVASNINLVANNRLSLRPLSVRRQRDNVRRAMAELQVRPNDSSLRAGGLSGGNQQKVVIGRWLTSDRKIFLLDEPTRGVDVGAKSEIYRVLREIANEGCAVIVSSSENAELIGLCDRVLTFFRGQINGDLSTHDLQELTVAEKIAGVHAHV